MGKSAVFLVGKDERVLGHKVGHSMLALYKNVYNLGTMEHRQRAHVC